MNTKHAVNYALQHIGRDGLKGLEWTARSLPELLLKTGLDSFPPTLLRQTAAELRRQKLIEVEKPTQKRLQVRLSVKGIHRLQRAQIEYITIPKPAHWDGRYRMVTYDVPRAQSASRHLLTRELKRLGFLMLRESVWFHPYPCFEQLQQVVVFCNLQRSVTFADVTRLDTVSEGKLRRHFAKMVG